MSTYRINELVGLYCGMNAEQASEFLVMFVADRKINQRRLMAFSAAGLVATKGDQVYMTPAGLTIKERILAIRNGTFLSAKPRFTTDELTALAENAGRLARKALPKARGLRSAHMKALAIVARHPGIVTGALLKNFSTADVGLLFSCSLIASTDIDFDQVIKYAPLSLTTQGLSLLNWCLNEIKLLDDE